MLLLFGRELDTKITPHMALHPQNGHTIIDSQNHSVQAIGQFVLQDLSTSKKKLSTQPEKKT